MFFCQIIDGWIYALWKMQFPQAFVAYYGQILKPVET